MRVFAPGFFSAEGLPEAVAFPPVALGLLPARSTPARRASMTSTTPVGSAAGSAFSTVSSACLASIRAATFSWKVSWNSPGSQVTLRRSSPHSPTSASTGPGNEVGRLFQNSGTAAPARDRTPCQQPRPAPLLAGLHGRDVACPATARWLSGLFFRSPPEPPHWASNQSLFGKPSVLGSCTISS